MIKRLFVLFALAYPLSLSGQTLFKRDSVKVADEVTVRGQRSRPTNVGSKMALISSQILEQAQTVSLSELLTENSTLHIKSMGKGAMATASFRGTSSNHTQVTWNGISMNSLTLGNFDFSQIPIFFTDKVVVNYGAGGFSRGSGALGGSVALENNSSNISKREFNILSEYGSNVTFTEGFAYKDKFKNTTIATRLYFQSSKNNYEYLNKVMMKDPFVERRRNAEYTQSGVMQEVYQKIGKGELSAVVWWQMNDRNLPPSIIVNTFAKEHQNMNDVRAVVGYKRGTLNVSAAYLYGQSKYSRQFDISLGDDNSINTSNSVQLNAEQRFALKKVELGYGVNYRFDKVVSDNFDDNSAQRNTLSARVYALYSPCKSLSIEGKAMGEMIDDKLLPTYTIGLNYQIIKNLRVKLSNSYNYRYPTLNDLYWTPGGNRDLKPERGLSSDLALAYTPRLFGSLYLNTEVSIYRMDINDWIMWIPTGNGYIWSPVNFSKVLSQGVEFTGSLSHSHRELTNRLFFNYTYAYSVDKSERGDGKTQDKQLPYIPRNKWNISYLLNWKNLGFYYNVSFTDIRYTSADQSYHTNAYTIHNASIDYTIQTKPISSIKIALKVENIFNAYYESTQYYPMPRRSLLLSLRMVI